MHIYTVSVYFQINKYLIILVSVKNQVKYRVAKIPKINLKLDQDHKNKLKMLAKKWKKLHMDQKVTLNRKQRIESKTLVQLI